ncbi:1-deoxy-D-xylulose-5-phosphate synthase [Acidipropionibacterium virtanenii]|uniref:1-deoxy-D-xylulose-5-phosphate synthase n=1 Tax=Acidipropionibacterium virtanenii TaxID=2057246 RepID=A0A344UUH6_9ACTN|nr:1-deoxy-D-xylulose-5-phosphate synthase [Acidipropionibacterium virtanenii]AXE38924.1 1-deoxy-D-xylulose-5-phosphate synthase [Acidipropionibacterium virtanenii]
MALLDRISCPDDLRDLSDSETEKLATEIRRFLIEHVSRTGGHLGPNLGVVELTLAIHRVFDSPNDPIVFDTGHQSYVHKIVTGRAGRFDTLRQEGGLSGYPSRGESPHDWVENSHASTSLSWAEGLAEGIRLRGEDRTVVAVIGDGALTGGMAWEALDSIAARQDLRLVIVVNDNGRSYYPTVGGLANRFSAIRTDPRYEETLDRIKQHVSDKPLGRQVYGLMHGVKAGMKDALIGQQGIFPDLGIKYLGPVDGHDLGTLERALEMARRYRQPVIVHAITSKGKGYPAAERDEEDHFHTVGAMDPVTCEPVTVSGGATWTSTFAETIADIGARREDVVAITAAMLHPVGLAPFAERFPERVLDVGIAEQHALTTAAGLSAAGLHPVIALYATFLNRAFDQLLMDVGMHHQGVTVVLDRAGITGSDGASHNGMWDISMAGLVPGLRLASPRDRGHLVELLEEAVDIDDGPSVIRYSKDRMPEEIAVRETRDGLDVLQEGDPEGLLLVAHGQLCGQTLSAARLMGGPTPTVVSPRWDLPVCDSLLDAAAGARAVLSVEDGLVVGGLGSRLSQELRLRGVWTPVRELGIPQTYLPHSSRASLLHRIGLDAEGIAASAARLSEAVEASAQAAQQA